MFRRKSERPTATHFPTRRETLGGFAATAGLALSGLGLGIGLGGPAHAIDAHSVQIDTSLGQSAVIPGKTKSVFLRINLEGIRPVHEVERTPVNVGIVIDRSGSMRGEKLRRAKEAAIMAINRLSRHDVAAIVAYNHQVDVVVPATRVAGHGEMEGDIRYLKAGGRTALYAGTRQGVQEVRKFLADNYVNRVILLSDGLANVGPSTPEALARLGREVVQSGISVTTIGLGLGYNEDLMAKLAYNSDGNHAFVENAHDLVKVFNQEFGDVLSVVAQDVIIEIYCGNGFRPMRVLGREARITGDKISLRLNQLYGAQNKYVVVELEVPAGGAEGDTTIADVTVNYRGMAKGRKNKLRSSVRANLTRSDDHARSSINKEVMSDVTVQVANEVSEQAVSLRDKGDVEGARRLLESNADKLEAGASLYSSPQLRELGRKNRVDAATIAKPGSWNKHRKSLRARQHGLKTQQQY